jgi:hypothetical protein
MLFPAQCSRARILTEDGVGGRPTPSVMDWPSPKGRFREPGLSQVRKEEDMLVKAGKFCPAP